MKWLQNFCIVCFKAFMTRCALQYQKKVLMNTNALVVIKTNVDLEIDAMKKACQLAFLNDAYSGLEFHEDGTAVYRPLRGEDKTAKWELVENMGLINLKFDGEVQTFIPGEAEVGIPYPVSSYDDMIMLGLVFFGARSNSDLVSAYKKNGLEKLRASIFLEVTSDGSKYEPEFKFASTRVVRIQPVGKNSSSKTWSLTVGSSRVWMFIDQTLVMDKITLLPKSITSTADVVSCLREAFGIPQPRALRVIDTVKFDAWPKPVLDKAVLLGRILVNQKRAIHPTESSLFKGLLFEIQTGSHKLGGTVNQVGEDKLVVGPTVLWQIVYVNNVLGLALDKKVVTDSLGITPVEMTTVEDVVKAVKAHFEAYQPEHIVSTKGPGKILEVRTSTKGVRRDVVQRIDEIHNVLKVGEYEGLNFVFSANDKSQGTVVLVRPHRTDVTLSINWELVVVPPNRLCIRLDGVFAVYAEDDGDHDEGEKVIITSAADVIRVLTQALEAKLPKVLKASPVKPEKLSTNGDHVVLSKLTLEQFRDFKHNIELVLQESEDTMSKDIRVFSKCMKDAESILFAEDIQKEKRYQEYLDLKKQLAVLAAEFEVDL